MLKRELSIAGEALSKVRIVGPASNEIGACPDKVGAARVGSIILLSAQVTFAYVDPKDRSRIVLCSRGTNLPLQPEFICKRPWAITDFIVEAKENRGRL